MNERVLIVLLILIVIVVLSNVAVFAALRGALRGDVRRMNLFNKPLEFKDKSMDELRKKMEELGDKGKDSPQDIPK